MVIKAKAASITQKNSIMRKCFNEEVGKDDTPHPHGLESDVRYDKMCEILLQASSMVVKTLSLPLLKQTA